MTVQWAVPDARTEAPAPEADADVPNAPSPAPAAAGSAVLLVGGTMCEMCDKHVKEALEALDGITSAAADHTSGKVRVEYTAMPDGEDIRAALASADYEYGGIESPETDASPMTRILSVGGMSCSHCEAAVKKALESLDGVVSAEVSHESGSAEVVLSAAVADDALRAAVEAEGYTVTGIR